MPEENSVPPERFIRTFQTDLAKVQGNEPAGPVPLPQPQQAEAPAKAPPAPAPTPTAPPPAPIIPPAPSVPPSIPKPVVVQPLPSAPQPAPKPVPPVPTIPVLQKPPVLSPPPAVSNPLPKLDPLPPPRPPLPAPQAPSLPLPTTAPVIVAPKVPLPVPAASIPPVPKPAPQPVIAAAPKVFSKPAPTPAPLPVQKPATPPAPLTSLPVEKSAVSMNNNELQSVSNPSATEAPAPLHTFGTDFSALFKHRKASVATIIAAQQDQSRSAPELYPKPKNHRTLIYVIIGGVLVALGIVAALYAYGSYLTKNMPVPLAPVAPAPIFVDERVQISGSGRVLLDAIAKSVAQPIAAGNVRLLYTAESLSGTSTVFASLELPAPGRVERNLKTNGAMAGAVRAGGVQSPFFILPVSSYGETFAGMLSWETSMKADLAALFPGFPPVVSVPAATTTASSTPAKKGTKVATTTPAAPGYIAGFKDEVVANHDARVYRDEADRVVLMYGYWNQSTLVIARDAAAFSEILQRLGTSRTE